MGGFFRLLVLFGLFQVTFPASCVMCQTQHIERGCPTELPYFDMSNDAGRCNWKLSSVDEQTLDKRCNRTGFVVQKNAFDEDVLRFICDDRNPLTRWTSVGFRFTTANWTRDIRIANDVTYITQFCLKCVNGKWLADSFSANGGTIAPGLGAQITEVNCFYADYKNAFNQALRSSQIEGTEEPMAPELTTE